MNKQTKILIGILIVASILVLWGLNRGDLMNDEVFYAFRAIGPLDFDEAEFQTTPLEWFDPHIPAWTSLSFHDHPPLVFWVQHVFISLFGENSVAFRIPSALLGIVSLYLLYLIGAKLFSKEAGLIAMAIFGFTLNHVYISRTGMQEAYVIFFILLSIYLFLKALENPRYLLWLGLSLGLGFLTKYTVFIMVPIFCIYICIYKREYFKNKNLWIAGLISILLFSPVLIYNYKLYKAVGHFDFQFSFIFGQNPEVWKVAPGKEIGSLAERVKDFVPNLVHTNSWLFLLLSAVVFLTNTILLYKNPKENYRRYGFLYIWLFFSLLLLLKIGPSFRFLTILTPIFALGIGEGLSLVFKKIPAYFQKAVLGIIVLLFIFEIFYSYNNQIRYYPVGPTPWLSSDVRYENYNWGYQALENYLQKEFEGKMPLLTFNPRYQFLDAIQNKALARDREDGLIAEPFLIVAVGNFDNGEKLWVLERRFIYHGWPILRVEDYMQFLQLHGKDYFTRSGFQTIYFIVQNNRVPPPELISLFKTQKPTPIKNYRGDEIFTVYKTTLP